MRVAELMRRGPGWTLSLLSTLARDRLLDLRDRVVSDEFFSIHSVVRPYTMSGNARLRGLYTAVRHVVENEIPGDVVECGTARGGSAALMGMTLQALGAQRDLWVFDTFEGIPPPTSQDPDRELAELYVGGFRGEYEEVRSLFEQLGILERAHLVKGLFQETLATAAIDSIAVLHVDGDWYDSVMVCCEQFYDRVSPGGVIQFDDYGHWAGARRAVDEFVTRRSIRAPLRRLDYTGRALVKP